MHYLIWRVRRRGDQAMISISHILKFSALESKKERRSSNDLNIPRFKVFSSELGTLEWNIPNPDRLNNLKINNKKRTCII